VKGQIVVLLDSAGIHWTAEIADWLGQPEVAARLTVERFPPYSPHLNPVELLNAAAKRRMGNDAADTMEVLQAKFQAAFGTTAQQGIQLLPRCAGAPVRAVSGCRVKVNSRNGDWQTVGWHPMAGR
jgi:hypothetical protein